MNIEHQTHVALVSQAIFRKTAPNVDVDKLAEIFHGLVTDSALAGDMPFVHGRVNREWFLSNEVVEWVKNEEWTMMTTLQQALPIGTSLPLVKASAPTRRR